MKGATQNPWSASRRFCRVALGWLTLLAVTGAWAAPKTVLISLDGAPPRLFETYLTNGVLRADQGLGRLKSRGTYARRNVTVTPSPTALTVTTYGIDYYSTRHVGSDVLSRVPAIVSQFRVEPRLPGVSASPALDVRIVNSHLELSWPDTSAGFVLQQSQGLGESYFWQNELTPPVVSGGRQTVQLTLEEGRFYRLVKH